MTLDQETDKALAYIYSNGKAVYGLDNNYNSNYRQQHILQNMYENNLAFSDKPYIRLKAHGIKIQEGGGWLKYLETQKQIELNKYSPTTINKNINITGNSTNSQINQDSDLRESPFIIAKDANNAPNPNEKRQNAIQTFIGIILNYWFIPVLIGLIILLIEYNSGFFIKSIQ